MRGSEENDQHRLHLDVGRADACGEDEEGQVLELAEHLVEDLVAEHEGVVRQP